MPVLTSLTRAKVRVRVVPERRQTTTILALRLPDTRKVLNKAPKKTKDVMAEAAMTTTTPLLNAQAAPPPALPEFRREFTHFAQVGDARPSPFVLLVHVDQDWLGFLRSYGGLIALAPAAPSGGSPVLLFDPKTGTFVEELLPRSVVVRQVEAPSEVPIPNMRGLLERGEAHFQRPVHAYTIYPAKLLAAMSGKVADDLEKRHLDPKKIRSVTIRYVPMAGGDYDVLVGEVANN